MCVVNTYMYIYIYILYKDMYICGEDILARCQVRTSPGFTGKARLAITVSLHMLYHMTSIVNETISFCIDGCLPVGPIDCVYVQHVQYVQHV